MKIGAIYSHLNGLEWLKSEKPLIWREIESVVALVDAKKCKTKVSKEKTKKGKIFYSPKDLNTAFKQQFYKLDWQAPGREYFYTSSKPDIVRSLIEIEDVDEQKELLQIREEPLIRSFNEADFLKDRVSLEVQFGKYSFVQFDIFVKHAANYMQNRIDLGVEIVPMKCMEAQMSSGPPYYEKHLHEILRQGRIFPPVPLVLIGLEP